MKKTLRLLSAAVLGFSAMAEDVDITPSNYYFNNCEKLPFDEQTYAGSNLEIKSWDQVNGAEKWDNGLINMVIYNRNDGNSKNLTSGIQLVNLGGEVGKVFCYAHNGTDVNDVLLEKTGYDYGIVPGLSGGPFFKMNFFLHPDNTPTAAPAEEEPTADNANIRVKVVYNLYSKNLSKEKAKPMIKVAYVKGDQGNSLGGAVENAAALPFEPCFDYDEDEEEDIYNPSMWKTYEFVVSCPADDEDGITYKPVYLNCEFNNWLDGGSTLFIKEITFHKTQDETTYGERKRENLVLAMGDPTKTTGINDVVTEEASVNVNGNTVTFSAPAMVYNLTGAQVAAGTEATLAKGIYVARIGEKAVKFAIK